MAGVHVITQTHKSDCLKQARGAFKNRKWEEALRIIDQGLKVVKSGEEESELNRLAAEIHLHRGNLTSARICAEASVSWSQEELESKNVYKSYMTLGRVYERSGRYSDATWAWETALRFANQYDNLRAKGRLLLNLSVIHQKLNMHNRALKGLDRAQRILEDSGDSRSIVVCLSRKIHSRIYLRQLDRALETARGLEGLVEQADSPEIRAMARFRVGSVYLERKEYNIALEHLSEAVIIYRKLGDIMNLAVSISELCRACIRADKWDDIQHLLRELADIAENEPLLNCAQLVAAEISAWSGNKSQSVWYYRDALDLAITIDKSDRFRAFHKSLTDILDERKLEVKDVEMLLKRARAAYERMGLEREAEEVNSLLSQAQ